MKNEKVNNHYVPKFYLRNFSNNKKSVGMFIKKDSTYIADASIKDQAYIKKLYGESGNIENMFMLVENKAQIIISKILLTKQLPPYESEEYSELLQFILLSQARVKKVADTQNTFMNELVKSIAELDDKVSINNLDIKINIPNLLPIQSTIANLPLLNDLKMILIVAKRGSHFLTSDNPVVLYNQMFVTKTHPYTRSYGIAQMGTQIFFPLSSEVCLCLFDSVIYKCKGLTKNILRLNNKRKIIALNVLFYINSYNYIFFKNKVSHKYIKSIADRVSNMTLPQNVFPALKGIVLLHNDCVKQKVDLDFFKTNSPFMGLPLPPTLLPPTRPYAEEIMNKEGEWRKFVDDLWNKYSLKVPKG